MNDLLWNNVISALFKHFYYSIEGINSYDELTEKEKSIIDKETFNYLIRINNNKCPKKQEV